MHRLVTFLVSLLAALTAYTHQPQPPALDLEDKDWRTKAGLLSLLLPSQPSNSHGF
ncbi:MAG TPA: hypothetical protein IGS37_13285 [Synechococcales cyanobacterium M55_K2018_004]|nr:hypothetical protein [Synechococcales cyanobacterium M55_K2018_004]